MLALNEIICEEDYIWIAKLYQEFAKELNSEFLDLWQRYKKDIYGFCIRPAKGFIFYQICPDYIQILSLAVQAKEQRSGIGRQLLAALKLYNQPIMVTTLAVSEVSNKFYRKNNFIDMGNVIDVKPNGEAVKLTVYLLEN